MSRDIGVKGESEAAKVQRRNLCAARDEACFSRKARSEGHSIEVNGRRCETSTAKRGIYGQEGDGWRDVFIHELTVLQKGQATATENNMLLSLSLAFPLETLSSLLRMSLQLMLVLPIFQLPPYPLCRPSKLLHPSASGSKSRGAWYATHLKLDAKWIRLIPPGRRIHDPPEATLEPETSVLAVFGIGVAVIERLVEESPALLVAQGARTDTVGVVSVDGETDEDLALLGVFRRRICVIVFVACGWEKSVNMPTNREMNLNGSGDCTVHVTIATSVDHDGITCKEVSNVVLLRESRQLLDSPMPPVKYSEQAW